MPRIKLVEKLKQQLKEAKATIKAQARSIEQLESANESVIARNDTLTAEVSSRNSSTAFREVLIIAKGNGDEISDTTFHLYKGDSMSFFVDLGGDVRTSVHRG